ncbi:tRNA pseudouridine(65) synthase TruC, partial [Neisseria sp. P0001.S004]
WAELTPHTGRKHQLRRHMKHIFHPIVGDTNYGDLRQNHAVAKHIGTQRLMLHAQSLSFQSIEDGSRMTVQAPIDNDWRLWMEKFKTEAV